MTTSDRLPTPTSATFSADTPLTMRLPRLGELVERLDRAVDAVDADVIVVGVEAALESAVARGDELVPASYHDAFDDHYGRRLLHRDPLGRYTVICMTWGAGQATPLHDHGDSWGSVCVYAGRIRVTPFTMTGEPEGGRWTFRAETSIDADPSTAASVIPPDDYHVISNPFDVTALSIHVYRGEMEACGTYLPTGSRGVYRREEKRLVYDE